MREPSEAPNVATFGGVRFESDSGDLKGPTGNARLAPQPSQLLAYLVARRGEVVARTEIGEHLWPGGNVEVDQGIAFAIREIRKGIGAAGGDPGALETIPRRGYRLAAEMHGPTGAAHSASASSQRRRLVIGGGVVFAIAAIALFGRPGGAPVLVVFEHAPATGPIDAAAATPTTDPVAELTATLTTDPFAELTATLTADLAAQLTTTLTATFEDRLRVIGPTGAAILDGPNDTEIARSELGACLVMSGSARLLPSDRQIESAAPPGTTARLRPAPDRVVVFTQVVRTRDRAHVWATQDTLPIEGAVTEMLPRIVEGVRSALGDC